MTLFLKLLRYFLATGFAVFTAGIVVAAAHLFSQDPSPSEDDIKEVLAGNICRCTGYGAIIRALNAVAGREPA